MPLCFWWTKPPSSTDNISEMLEVRIAQTAQPQTALGNGFCVCVLLSMGSPVCRIPAPSFSSMVPVGYLRGYYLPISFLQCSITYHQLMDNPAVAALEVDQCLSRLIFPHKSALPSHTANRSPQKHVTEA